MSLRKQTHAGTHVLSLWTTEETLAHPQNQYTVSTFSTDQPSLFLPSGQGRD